VRILRTISRSSPRTVSAISAAPVSGWSTTGRHSSSGIASVAAATGLSTRIPIE
jgi:hypothetical protein